MASNEFWRIILDFVFILLASSQHFFLFSYYSKALRCTFFGTKTWDWVWHVPKNKLLNSKMISTQLQGKQKVWGVCGIDFRWFPVFSVTPSKIIKGRTSRQTSNDDSMMTYLAVPSAGCTPERRGSLEDCKSLQDHDLGDSSLFAR